MTEGIETDCVSAMCEYNLGGGDYISRRADYLLANGVVVFPCKVGDIIDKVISHNAIVAIWLESKHYSDLLWKGMAHKIPQKYKLMPFKRIFGIIPETIDESDTVNILVEAQKALERRKDNE